MQLRVLGCFLVLLAGCAHQTLDTHIRAANDLRLTSDRNVPALRAACPAPASTADCRTVYEAQHAFVDAHVSFVTKLQVEAGANRWRRPEDRFEANALCQAYAHYVEAARAVGVSVAPVSRNVAQMCGGGR